MFVILLYNIGIVILKIDKEVEMIIFVFLIHAGALFWVFRDNTNIILDPKVLLIGLSVFIIGLCIGFFFGKGEGKNNGVNRIRTGGEKE
jgi:hypothetical protein